MKKFLLQFFTWWNGQTLGTRFFTWRKGERVGADQFGNIYYKERKGLRRWVIYNGLAEPSKVPSQWHGWLHYTVDNPPTESQDGEAHDWLEPHIPNLTGTPYSYRPAGSLARGGTRNRVSSDYQPWTPE